LKIPSKNGDKAVTLGTECQGKLPTDTFKKQKQRVTRNAIKRGEKVMVAAQSIRIAETKVRRVGGKDLS